MAITGAIVGGFIVLYAVLVEGQSPWLAIFYVVATVAGFVLWRRHRQSEHANT